MILSLIFIWICISKSRKSRIFCNRSLPAVIKHKSPFRKTGTGLSVLWQVRQSEQGTVWGYSGFALLLYSSILSINSYKNSGCENPFWDFTAAIFNIWSCLKYLLQPNFTALSEDRQSGKSLSLGRRGYGVSVNSLSSSA